MKTFCDQKRFQTDKRPWLGELDDSSKGEFNFAVVGDRTGFALNGVFEDTMDALKNLNPDFVLSVGDLIEGYWLDHKDAHKEWDDMDLCVQKLELPFFRAIGNHDCGSELMMDVWRERYGHDYYAFCYRNILFLISNTEDPPIPIPEKYIPVLRELEQLVKHNPATAEQKIQAFLDQIPEDEKLPSTLKSCIGDIQIKFIQQVLEENQNVDWTFIVMHRPLWKTDDPNYVRLENILKDRKYTLFAGHLHNLEVTESKGNYQIQMGRTGACKHKKEMDDFHHFLWVSVKDGVPNFSVIKLEGISAIESFKKR